MNKKWFRFQLHNANKPQSALAELLNLQPSSVSRALNGTRSFKAEEISKIAEFLGASVNEVIAAIDGKEISCIEREFLKIPIVGFVDTVNGGTVGYYSDSNSGAHNIMIKAKTGFDNYNKIGLTVCGDYSRDFLSGTDLIFAKTGEHTKITDGQTILFETTSSTGNGQSQSIGSIKGLGNNSVSIDFISNKLEFSRERLHSRAVENGKEVLYRSTSPDHKLKIIGVLINSIRPE